MLNAATTHYTRTLARPGTALPNRPTPLSGSSAQWDSLTGNICELVANVASASADAQTYAVDVPSVAPRESGEEQVVERCLTFESAIKCH